MGKTEGTVYTVDYLTKEGLETRAEKVESYVGKKIRITKVEITPNCSEEFGTRTKMWATVMDTDKEVVLFCFAQFLEATCMVIEKNGLYPFETTIEKSLGSYVWT